MTAVPKKTTIPAGYRVTIDSWENDGDANNTKVLAGLTEDGAKFIVGFAQFFRSSSRNEANCFGNMYEPDDEEWQAMKDVVVPYIKQYFHVIPEFGFDLVDPDEDQDEYASDMIGEFSGMIHGYSEYYQFRVTDSIKVEHTPLPVFLEDVTDQFVE